MNLGRFDFILGILELELYNPYISFKDKSILFNLNYYISNYLRYTKPALIYSDLK